MWRSLPDVVDAGSVVVEHLADDVLVEAFELLLDHDLGFVGDRRWSRGEAGVMREVRLEHDPIGVLGHDFEKLQRLLLEPERTVHVGEELLAGKPPSGPGDRPRRVLPLPVERLEQEGQIPPTALH